jgi:hypothetical protein
LKYYLGAILLILLIAAGLYIMYIKSPAVQIDCDTVNVTYTGNYDKIVKHGCEVWVFKDGYTQVEHYTIPKYVRGYPDDLIHTLMVISPFILLFAYIMESEGDGKQ